MASYPPPGVPPVPPPTPPPGYDPREQRRFFREQARAQRDAFRAQRDQMRYQMRAMRRGSVLGPILLIAIGVVFLLIETGRLDHDRFWTWYGHWWPLVLVSAGAVVLAEWAIDQAVMRDPQRPAYRRSVGSGVVFLLVLFAFGGAISNHVLGFPSGHWSGFGIDQGNFDEFFGDKHESDQMLDVALPAGGSITVVNPRGDVTVNGTSDDGRVHLALHKQIYSRSDADADSRAQQFSPAVTTNGYTVSINMPSLDGARGDLVITVPAAATVTINANRGDIHVASIKAPVTATANHGDVELSAITGPAKVRINSGGSSFAAHNIDGGVSIQGHAEDVTVSDITGPVAISGEFFGTTHLERINGATHFHTSRTDLQLARLDGQVEISPNMDLSADQAMGPVVLTTRDRNITLERIAGDIAVTNRDGRIVLTAAPVLGNITLEDRNGSVSTTLPEKASFTVQADTSDGSVDTDFALTTRSSENGRSLSGTVGSGGPVVHITTTDGDITVRKGEVQPLPVAAPAPPKITLTPPTAPAAPKAAKTPKAAPAN